MIAMKDYKEPEMEIILLNADIMADEDDDVVGTSGDNEEEF